MPNFRGASNLLTNLLIMGLEDKSNRRAREEEARRRRAEQERGFEFTAGQNILSREATAEEGRLGREHDIGLYKLGRQEQLGEKTQERDALYRQIMYKSEQYGIPVQITSDTPSTVLESWDNYLENEYTRRSKPTREQEFEWDKKGWQTQYDITHPPEPEETLLPQVDIDAKKNELINKLRMSLQQGNPLQGLENMVQSPDFQNDMEILGEISGKPAERAVVEILLEQARLRDIATQRLKEISKQKNIEYEPAEESQSLRRATKFLPRGLF